MTRIRSVTEADLPEVLRMVHALAAYHDDAAIVTIDDLKRDMLGRVPWVKTLLAQGRGYVALCPLVQLQFGVRGMDIHHLYVEKHARGNGVGRALIVAAIEASRELGCRYIAVGTHPDNLEAQAVYKTIGFEQIDSAGPRFRMKL